MVEGRGGGGIATLYSYSILKQDQNTLEQLKDPGHSAKSPGGKLQLNMHAPYICGFA